MQGLPQEAAATQLPGVLQDGEKDFCRNRGKLHNDVEGFFFHTALEFAHCKSAKPGLLGVRELAAIA